MEEAAVAAVRELARPHEGGHMVVGDADLETLARRWQTSPREVARLALSAGVVPLRYVRNLGAVGVAGQARLLGAWAAVIGLGGVGGLVAEILARAGGGTLVLVDGDAFEETNLNRQILSSRASLGRPKAEVARERLLDVNPHVEVVACCQRLTRENARSLLAGPAGGAPADRVVIDCLDTGRDRLVLQDACRELGLPLVHGAIRGWRGRCTLVLPRGPGLELFYGRDDVPSGAEAAAGAPGPAPALLAAWQAGQALRVLLGDTSAAGQVFTFDLGSGQAAVIPFFLARVSAAWHRRRRKKSGQA